MCPSPSSSASSTCGSTFASRFATARDESGDLVPVMSSTGTSSVANAASGVGSSNSASFQSWMSRTDSALAARTCSGMRSNDPRPIQKSMKKRAAPGASPFASEATEAATVSRMPSTSPLASTMENSVGS